MRPSHFLPLVLSSFVVACGLQDVEEFEVEASVEGVDGLVAPTGGALEVFPSADAYVRSGAYANTGFGTSTKVRADRYDVGTEERGYVRFSVGNVGLIRSAKLRLYVTNPSPQSADVSTLGAVSWDESTLTYNNRPSATGTLIASLVATAQSTWVDLDVTKAVASQSTTTFLFVGRSDDGFAFSSREAGSASVRLVLTPDVAPAVTVTSPVAQAQVSGVVTLSADAADDVAVSSVEFFVGTSSLGKGALSGGAFRLAFDTKSLPDGAYSVIARATDSAGQSTSSSAVAFTIKNASVVEPATCPSFNARVSRGVPGSPVNEASGLAVSRKNAHVIWTHNDSGDIERLIAIDMRNANIIGFFGVSTAQNGDWEDIAMGPGPTPGVDYLYVGRIGSGSSSKEIVRVAEPSVSADSRGQSKVLSGIERFKFVYPGGASYDAEGMFVDSTTGDVYVLTKSYSPKLFVYRAPLNASATKTLEHVIDISFNPTSTVPNDKLPTAADMSPSGDEIVMKTYNQTYLWKRSAGQSVKDALLGTRCDVPYPGGSEAIAFSADGRDLYSLSEGSGSPLYFVARK